VTDNRQHIVVVGGGSAGWLAACYIAATQERRAVSVTLVESPTVPSLGVGEGTWPSMRNTLNIIGVPEAQFLSECHASFKQGSKFVGWRDAQDCYHHPFMEPKGYTEWNVAAHWNAAFNNIPYGEAFCVQPEVCNRHLAPKQFSTPDYAYVTNYGYHFDAGKLTQLLTRHGTNMLGIHHIIDHVESIHSHENGDIQSLKTRQSGNIEGDLFIDCSGMNSVLFDAHFGIPWIKTDDVLLNDSAVAAQVPYSHVEAAIESTTVATAQAAGWTWDIGLYHRRGVGLCYSSHYLSKQGAENTLRQYIVQTKGNADSLQLRHLHFTPGYRSVFWQNNCIAIGMSAGFIEPLEASALAMVELSLSMLCDEFPQNHTHRGILAKRFNQRFLYRWQRVIDFVKLHYVLSQRQEPYWLAQRAITSIPERLAELLKLWQFQAPSRNDFIENEEVFSSSSYQYILYGMQFQTHFNTNRLSSTHQNAIQKLHKELQVHQQKLLSGLPSNREYLNLLHQTIEQNKHGLSQRTSA
jgi:flavin-dependent dehydrogenase